MKIYSFLPQIIDDNLVLTNNNAEYLSIKDVEKMLHYLNVYKKNIIDGKINLDLKLVNCDNNTTIKVRKTKSNISKSKRQQVLHLHGNSCLLCNSNNDVCIDHIIPIKKGGTNDISNLQPLCRVCNSKKRVQIIDYRKK